MPSPPRKHPIFIPIVCIVTVALSALLGSCSTGREGMSQYVRNGVQYGVTKGRFRGRWWNYYERGRSFEEGRFWAEAEKDFRRALIGRSGDKLWARTYGLHFLPEYFPNRELGIALYYEDHNDDAITYLERSYNEQHSARAAYYLGLARKKRLEAGHLDHAPPAFAVTSGLTASAIGNAVVDLKGTATDDTYVASVKINGEAVPIDMSAPKVTVEQQVRLKPGVNEFTVEVSDLVGHVTKQKVTLKSDVDGPAVSFDAPITVPGKVTGVAYDVSGVKSFTFGANAAAALRPGDNGVVRFEMTVAQSQLSGALQYTCTDSLGNATRGNIPVNVVSLRGDSPFHFAATQAMVSIASGIDALVENGQVIALAKAGGQTGQPSIHFVDPSSGQTFYESEIAMEVEIDSDQPIKTAKIGDASLDLIPGRTNQRISRRILVDRPGKHSIPASLVTNSGATSQDEITIQRKENEVESVGKLEVAFLGCTYDTVSKTLDDGTDIQNVLYDWLSGDLSDTDRFRNILERDPNLMQKILNEQELSATLGDKSKTLAVGKIFPAEMLIMGKVHRLPDNVDIRLEGWTTEVYGMKDAVRMVDADVSGPAGSNEELRELLRVLALKFEQQLPRVQGHVVLVDKRTAVTDLSKKDGIRPELKVVVYRDEIIPGINGGKDLRRPKIVAQGILDQVTTDTSDVQILKTEGTDTIERGQFVVTK